MDIKQEQPERSVNVRLATSAEMPHLCLLYNQTVLQTEGLRDRTLSEAAFASATIGEVVLVATDDSGIVGFVSLWEPDRFIHHLYVSPDAQGKGVGTLLLFHCEQRVGRPLNLKCSAGNERAYQFYENLGWVMRVRGMGSEGPYFHFWQREQ